MQRLYLRLTLLICVCASATACLATHAAVTTLAGAPSCRPAIGGNGAPVPQAIQWLEPEAPEQRRALSAWCAGVGPAVIAPAAGDVSPQPLTELVILDWNMHVGGGDLPGLVAALRRGDLTGGRPVPHFVVLLQEVFRGGAAVPLLRGGEGVPARIEVHPPVGARTDIVVQARELGLGLFYAASMRNGGGPGAPEDRGNAILSTLPLSDFTAVELPFERQRRIAIFATVTLTDGLGASRQVRVGSAHLDATGGFKRLRVFASGLRARQARSLVTALERGVPMILGSDLNTWASGPDEDAYRELRASFPESSPVPALPTLKGGRTLDYLFYRLPAGWQAAYQRLDDRYGSDHYPLLGRVQMTDDTAAR